MTEQRRGGLPPVSGSRTLSRAVDRRRQIIAGAWIAGFLTIVLLVWIVVVAGGDSDGGDVDGLAAPDPSPDAAADPDDATDVGDGSADTRDAPEPDDDPRADEPGESDPGGDARTDEEPDDPDDATDSATTTLTFDGVCTVELPEADIDDDPRPWDFDACEHAPIGLEPGGERWIVVRASLPANEFDAAAAAGRTASIGDDTRLLWSTHYPSLAPDLWVAFQGPYPDADAAAEAADAIGGGAYPRALTPR